MIQSVSDYFALNVYVVHSLNLTDFSQFFNLITKGDNLLLDQV